MSRVRGEFIVEAESAFGVQRGVNLALKHIENNVLNGEKTIENHGITVKWRLIPVVEIPPEQEQTIAADELPQPRTLSPQLEPAVPAAIPDISVLDIEDAKGIIEVAATLEDCDELERIEKGNQRTVGGRQSVFGYIEKKRKELKRAALAAAKKAAAKAEAEAAASEIPLPEVPGGEPTPEPVPAPEPAPAPKPRAKSTKTHKASK